MSRNNDVVCEEDNNKFVQEEFRKVGRSVFMEYAEFHFFYDDVRCLEPLLSSLIDALEEIVIDCSQNFDCNIFSQTFNLWLRSGIQFFIDWHSSELTSRLKPHVEQFDLLLKKQLTTAFWSKGLLNYARIDARPEHFPSSHVWWSRYIHV
jgi:hypothetical protein